MAECSESTGITEPPAALAIASRAGADEAFLVGQGDDRARARGGHGGGQAGGADDGRHHPVRAHGGGLGDRGRAGGGAHARPDQAVFQRQKLGLILDDRDDRLPAAGLLDQPFDVTTGRQGQDLDRRARLLEEAQGRKADRSGRTQHHYLAG
jgi:hypothetical protein